MATQATLINPATGKKVVVEAGSQQAQTYFGQGFKLMGADGKPVGTQSPAPAGTTPPAVSGPQGRGGESPVVGGPAAISPASTGQKATLYGPGGIREVVDVGSTRASELQGLGWTLTEGQARDRKQATLRGPNGERRAVFIDSPEEKDLFSKGYILDTGGPGIGTSDSVRRNQGIDARQAGDDMRDQDLEIADLERKRRLKELRTEVFGDETAPEPPDLTADFNQLREQYGVAGLEQSVNNIDSQIRDLDESFRLGKQEQSNRRAPMSVIRGEQAELSDQYQEQRNALVLDRATVVDQLNSANSIISTMMQFTQQDFTNATQAYNTRYQEAMDIYNIWNKEQDSIKADASANLSTLINFAADSGKGWNDLDAGMQASISKMESAAGLPSGTIRTFMVAKPDARLITTVEGYDSAGNGVISFVYADANGNPGVVKTVKTGTTKTSGGGGSGSGTNEATGMSASELKADYELSLDGLATVIQVNAGDAGAAVLQADIPGTPFKRGMPLTRDAAIRQLFNYYQGRVSFDTIAKDVYDRYPDAYQRPQ